MSDFNHHSGPEQQPQIEKPAIIKTAESLGVGPQTGKAVFDTKKGVATILVKGDAKKETSELNDNFKKEFIEKLKKLPNYQGSKVQEAIEKGTIEIKRVPNREIYAIYENKTGNLIYLTLLNGEQYTNVFHFRNKELLGDAIKGGFVRQGYKGIELDAKTGLRKLFKKDGKEVHIFSDEYVTATLNAVNYMRDFIKEIREEAEKRRKNDIK